MSMREVRSIVFFLSVLPVQAVLAQPGNQDCATATTLCAQQPVAGSNAGAAGLLPTLCPPGGSLVWYTFITNSVGGIVDLNVSGINCPSIVGMDNELSLLVLNFGIPCDIATYSVVNSCEQDSVDFTVSVPGLAANTQYWAVVAGVQDNGASLPAECAFNISTSGPGANIVGVDFSAGPDITLPEGSNTQLLATGGSTYLWTPNSGLSGDDIADPFAQPTETTTYTVSTELNGCTYMDEVVVEVKRLISPFNTITPNGDGRNDVWEIFGINDYPQSKVSIYDRWGQRVFSSVGYKEPFNGEGLPTATYYWIIELNILQGVAEPYTGFLTIIN
ncbi:MAG: gliding motility-associated C-terminal domain-containing protein [Flavobacteriales bacterium]|nr:gliding motility-associated C-terminal domain-containing protein [Flavobacteriales bacterium]